MTIKNLYPPNRPTSVYNVVNGRAELPPAGSFARASKATVGTINGNIVEVDNDVPRFSYDPLTKEFEGLLLETATTQCVQDNESESAWAWSNTASDGTILGLPAFTTQRPVDYGDSSYIFLLNSMPSGNWTANFYVDFNHAAVAPEPYLGVYMYTADGGYLPWSVTKDITAGSPTFGKPIITRLTTGSGNVSFIEEAWKEVAPEIFQISLRGVMVGGTIPSNNRLYISSPPAPYSNRIAGVSLYADNQPLFSSFVSSTTRNRADDSFSLAATKNYNNGFSMLLDSETATDSFIYRLKAGGTVGAELSNNAGTLDWNVNGNSAAISGDYPQVGFVKGRVRTISSFTEAGDTVNPNYLYTKGLSFPTVGAPLANLDTLEFGIPQTLKAVYIWSGQLEPVQAVSIIKGDQNIVPNIPIVANKYSFVYNIDPTDIGETKIRLPFIVPTAVSGGMTVDWGDGSPIRPYNKGVTLSHDYPYPGQYRIQISGNETWVPAGDITGTLTGGGFDDTRLGNDVDNAIIKVDQWAPQFRTTASGDGYTGADMIGFFKDQTTLEEIPPFKYTGLTDLTQIFYGCYNLKPNGWNWVPTDLSDAVTLNSTFLGTMRNGKKTVDELKSFPRLTTSSKLKSVYRCFQNCRDVLSFDVGGSGIPFTNTSGVTNFNGLFESCRALESIGFLDTSAAIDIGYIHYDNYDLTSVPTYDTRNVKEFSGALQNCTIMTSVPKWDTSNGINFSGTWYRIVACTSFPGDFNLDKGDQFNSAWFGNTWTSFPAYDFKNAANFSLAWYSNVNLTSFPADTKFPKGTRFFQTWQNCNKIVEFPTLQFPEAKVLSYAWAEMESLEAFNQTEFPKGEIFEYTWFGNTLLDNRANLGESSSFPNTEFPEGTNFYYCWYKSSSFTIFPPIKIPKATTLEFAWGKCSSLELFPQLLYPNVTNFNRAWYQCDKLKTFDTFVNDKAALYEDTWMDCSLTANSVENILVSIDNGGVINGKLGIQGVNNADYSTWTQAAKDALASLITKGWDVDYTGKVRMTKEASEYYVNHEDGKVSFGKTKPGVVHVSGKENQETFVSESDAIKRVLEIDADYFPTWERRNMYQAGAIVKLGDSIYRALTDIDMKDYMLPDMRNGDEVEVATPINRQARWAEVYDPNELNEEESDRGPVQRSA